MLAVPAITAFVLGEHGDSSVINWTGIGLAGIKIPELTIKKKLEIKQRITGAAMEIIKGRGATWDGIAAGANDLVRAVANDERRILPVSIVQNKAAYSLPRIIGRKGVIKTLTPEMNAVEKKSLSASIRAIQKTYKIIE